MFMFHHMMFVCVGMLNVFLHFLNSLGKGEDKEYPTIGARLIRLEDKVGTLQSVCVCFVCVLRR